MDYISVFIAPLFIMTFVWIVYGRRDSYRKARERFVFMLLMASVIMASAFFLFRSSNEIWEVSNGFSWIAVIGLIVAVATIYTMKDVKIKKYASDFDVLEQETMYETGIPLDLAYRHRVIKYSGGKPSKLTTNNIDLNVVDSKKDLLPHLKKEIVDIINGLNSETVYTDKIKKAGFYEYGLTKVDPRKTKISDIEKTLSPFYKGVLKVAQTNLNHFQSPIPFKEAMAENDYVVEYAILYILEKAKAIKNTPMGNLGSLVESPQDEHLLGACGSLGFTSVGRYGIAIYVGYKLLWHEKNQITKG